MNVTRFVCEPDFHSTANYVVRVEVRVHASTPGEAARVARDMMLDPDTRLTANVHATYWHDEAGDLFAREDHGWWVYFGDGWPTHQILGGEIEPYDGHSVWPSKCVEWQRVT